MNDASSATRIRAIIVSLTLRGSTNRRFDELLRSLHQATRIENARDPASELPPLRHRIGAPRRRCAALFESDHAVHEEAHLGRGRAPIADHEHGTPDPGIPIRSILLETQEIVAVDHGKRVAVVVDDFRKPGRHRRDAVELLGVGHFQDAIDGKRVELTLDLERE